MIADGWLGGVPSAEVASPRRRRPGAVRPDGVSDPADTGELRLKARHGPSTPAEMYIPLLGWRAS